MRRHILIAASSLAAALGIAAIASDEHGKPVERQWVTAPVAPALQTREQAAAKSTGCMDCHRETDQPSMHASPAVVLGCADCHGGDAGVRWSGP
ncbi:MAG TPA: hypothetical protein VD701_08155, partial [Steroidobacteraceae bacterium]|nr:hypothetical protein [Steroidobacteraceae bacterium]